MAQEARFYTGLASYYRGDFAKSEAAFKSVAEHLPLPEVYNNLGVASSRQGKRDAVAYFQRAAQDDPSDADYRFNLAVELYRTGDTSGAVRQLREALNQRPGDGEARAFFDRLGGDTATLAQASSGTAVKAPLERIKRNYDENTFRQMEMQLQAAAEVKLAKADPRTHARYHVSHGDELLSQGFVTEADREYREAISLDASNAQAHAGLARVLENNGDANGARAEADAALRLRQFADPLLVMARLDLRDNKTEAAAESVDRALQLEPANGSAQALKRVVAAKLAEKAQPLPKP
jgi:tetratricopeptide (TPR) repeat protein